MSRSRGALALARTGLSQADIARRVVVSPQYVSMLLSGKETPAQAKRVAFHEAYDIDPTWWDEPGVASPSVSSPVRPVLDLDAAAAQLRAEMKDPASASPLHANLVHKLVEQLTSDACPSVKLLMVMCAFDGAAGDAPFVHLLRTRWAAAREPLLQAYEAERYGETFE